VEERGGESGRDASAEPGVEMAAVSASGAETAERWAS